MPDADQVAAYVSTRRQLRGIAESLIAGPQHRAAGTIRLAVRPDGFAGTALTLAVHGADFAWQDGSAALTGPVEAIAAAAGVDYGPPVGLYDVVDPMPIDTVLSIDPAAAEVLHRSLYAGGFALTQVLPDGHPVLWPEHFDVACSTDEATYGVCAGDDFHPMPYAYVAPSNPSTASDPGGFWNAPFGAARPLDLGHGVDELAADVAAFLADGASRLTGL